MVENSGLLAKYLVQGVYVISVANGREQNAFTAAWLMQVSFNPPLLAFSINPKHYSFQLLKAGKVCTVNVLGQNHLAIAAHFASPGVKEKMTTYAWRTGNTSAPILADGLAAIECQLKNSYAAGDHNIAVCEITSVSELNSGWPLLYSQTGTLDKISEPYCG